MARRQLRRSFSLSAVTALRLKRYCHDDDLGHRSCSGFLEEIVTRELDAAGAPKVDRSEVIKPSPKTLDADGVLREVRRMASVEDPS